VHAVALYSYVYCLKHKWEIGKAGSDDLLYLAAEAFNGILLRIAVFVRECLQHTYRLSIGDPATDICFYQQLVFPNTAYIVSLNSYFMAIWYVLFGWRIFLFLTIYRFMRPGISVSHMCSLRVMIDNVHKQVPISFLFVMMGITFSTGGTVICLRKFARVQEMRHGHLPLVFILPAISSKFFCLFF